MVINGISSAFKKARAAAHLILNAARAKAGFVL
jgi:hypothetical protein